MGVVWQAMDERLQRLVAVKQLLLQPDLSPKAAEESRARALREARIADRLHHPNAIVVSAVAARDGEPCLVMEYLPSRSLAAVLAEQGSLPVAEVASIGKQVASALAAAHAAQIVHRDVKPGNILIAAGGTAKITDFGVSRAAGDVTVTQTGMMAGTPAYLAPAVARGQVPTPASDVFSLGATLYAAVEGRAPFGDGDNPLARLHAGATGEVPPPRHAGALFAVLMSLLAADPATRPDMDRASRALAAVRTTRPVPIPVPSTLTPTRAPEPASLPPPAAASPVPVSAPAAAQFVTAQPAAGRAQPRPDHIRVRTQVLLVGAILAVLALAGSGVLLLLSGGSSEQQSVAPQSPPATSVPAAAPPATPTPSQVQPVSQGSIGYSEAGWLVINYYNGLKDLQSAWKLLSPTARATFGSEQNFQAHWSQYASVSARNANGVTPNPDGTVNVPVDVTYTTAIGEQTVKQHLRVTRLDGGLLIDSDPR